ncbi:hypothetical protein CDAR_209641 [Caerostris darwini]|uniref:Uncharacterized protein n=1 Tax=Caerostris darwini TaxID=1538125 RepID=A0AAV4T0L2_9ARAC|nr:hypothetical protein CDAR_209641 [Caerostris darwini]
MGKSGHCANRAISNSSVQRTSKSQLRIYIETTPLSSCFLPRRREIHLATVITQVRCPTPFCSDSEFGHPGLFKGANMNIFKLQIRHSSSQRIATEVGERRQFFLQEGQPRKLCRFVKGLSGIGEVQPALPTIPKAAQNSGDYTENDFKAAPRTVCGNRSSKGDHPIVR